MNGERKLKILFVEDMEPDYELAENELKKSGISFEAVRVENSSDFEKALNTFRPNLVISDYSLPQFNGMMALKIAKTYNELLPFIILTGTLNEETAVECMKSGATDYVIKEHISKLPYAVREANRFRETMSEKIKAEAALLESESRYRSIFEKNQAVMLLVNSENGEIIDVNPAAMEYYGYCSKDEFCGNITEISITEEADLRERMDSIMTGTQNYFTAKHIQRSGRIRDVEVFCSPVSYMGKRLFHLIVHDITDRNKAVEALHSSLKQKKELISEIYHRTKNSMQIIISMLTLQSIYAGDEKLERILGDMENRIRAMALVHEKLYQSQNLSRLNLKDYLTELINNIIAGYGIKEDKISVNLQMDDVDVLIDSAIPCGLVTNELISNVARHAFTDEKKGTLTVYLCREISGEIELVVADNGAGMDIDDKFNNAQTMGLQIVRNIVEYQLKGRIVPDSTAGMKWTLRFTDNVYEERV